MKIAHSELTSASSQYLGKCLWVCDYRRDDLDKKAIRALVPTYATLVPVDENDRVYYSETYFIRNSGSKAPIKIFDNTGYRSFAGVAIAVFTEEDECREFFAKQCLDIEERLQKRIDNIVEALKADQRKITDLRIEHS